MRHLATILILLAVGCTATPDPGTDLKSTGTGLTKIEAHNTSATNLTARVLSHASKGDKPILEGVQDEHKLVAEGAGEAEAGLAKYTKDVRRLNGLNAALAGKLSKATHQVGYVVWDWLSWLWHWFWLLSVIGLALHLILIGAAMLIPPPWDKVVGVTGRLINPWGWGLAIVERIRVKKALLTPAPN